MNILIQLNIKKGGTGSFVWKWVGSQYKVENMWSDVLHCALCSLKGEGYLILADGPWTYLFGGFPSKGNMDISICPLGLFVTISCGLVLRGFLLRVKMPRKQTAASWSPLLSKRSKSPISVTHSQISVETKCLLDTHSTQNCGNASSWWSWWRNF